MFAVPESSSLPSTPNPRQRRTGSSNAFASLDNPSTTPAGPPPNDYALASTTPAGPPPPSSHFGSSRLQQSNLFAASNNSQFSQKLFNSSPLRQATHSTTSRGGYGRRRYVDGDDDIEEEGGERDYDDDAMDEGVETLDGADLQGWDQSTAAPADDDMADNLFTDDSLNIPAIAKGLAAPPAALTESDDFILETENVIERVNSVVESGTVDALQLEASFADAAETLQHIWRTGQGIDRQSDGIGPGATSSPFTKAYFVSSLALAVNCPALSPTPRRTSLGRTRPIKPVPETLLDWLRNHHNPYPDNFSLVNGTRPNPTAHPRYWDVIISLTVRGELAEAIQLLKDADFEYAASAVDDGAEDPGYRGKQLAVIQKAVNRALGVYESCPGIQSGDWNVVSNDWHLFRKRVRQALSDLDDLAHGTGDDGPAAARSAGAGRNNKGGGLSMGERLKRAASKVPFFVYNSLQTCYGLLLGLRDELASGCADWLEAAIAFTVWWDGESDDDGRRSLANSTRSIATQGRLVDRNPRRAYQDRLKISLRQVLYEQNDAELQVNTLDAVEVAVASVIEQDLAGVISILRGWSSLIGTAMAELASYGAWQRGSRKSPSKKIMNGFDQSDLLVLSFGQQADAGPDSDAIRLAYAKALPERRLLTNSKTKTRREGWQLAIRVLGRLEDTSVAHEQINTILNQLQLTGVERVENIVEVCTRLGLDQQARDVAEKFGDRLVEQTDEYGDALFYYARAHQKQKLKRVVDVLVMTSLTRSAAFPSELDRTLASLTHAPHKSLSALRRSDPDAADLLSIHLSGYATVRRFYELRDQGVASVSAGSRKREAAAALCAAVVSAADSIHGGLFDADVDSVLPVESLLLLLGEALMFLSQASQHCPPGGSQAQRVLTSRQTFTLMKAIEDISTIAADGDSSGVFAQCEKQLKAAIASAHGSTETSPRIQLRQSLSTLTAATTTSSSSQFSLIGSKEGNGVGESQDIAMDEGIDSRHTGDTENSGVLVSKKGAAAQRKGVDGTSDGATESAAGARAWDWRMGLDAGATGTKVLRILRLGLAREVSMLWIDDIKHSRTDSPLERRTEAAHLRT